MLSLLKGKLQPDASGGRHFCAAFIIVGSFVAMVCTICAKAALLKGKHRYNITCVTEYRLKQEYISRETSQQELARKASSCRIRLFSTGSRQEAAYINIREGKIIVANHYFHNCQFFTPKTRVLFANLCKRCFGNSFYVLLHRTKLLKL
jgi:hypothetical protein